jgi:hypothetical protein
VWVQTNKNSLLFITHSINRYLKAIDVKRWVNYAQVASGAATWGWRTNNMGEIAQQWLRELRKCDPLTFLSGLVQNVFKKLTSIAADYATYRRQSPHQVVGNLVPHGIKLYLQRVDAARHCQVTMTGPRTAIVRYVVPLVVCAGIDTGMIEDPIGNVPVRVCSHLSSFARVVYVRSLRFRLIDVW